MKYSKQQSQCRVNLQGIRKRKVTNYIRWEHLISSLQVNLSLHLKLQNNNILQLTVGLQDVLVSVAAPLTVGDVIEIVSCDCTLSRFIQNRYPLVNDLGFHEGVHRAVERELHDAQRRGAVLHGEQRTFVVEQSIDALQGILDLRAEPDEFSGGELESVGSFDVIGDE